MEMRLGHALVCLGVDYEMSGKDLSESVNLSSKITRIMGACRLKVFRTSFPRSAWSENFQIERQRAERRRMADLRDSGIAVTVHV